MKMTIGVWLTAAILSRSWALAEAPDTPSLTLKEAQELAVRNHPKINAGGLKALAAKQTIIQVRSAFFPTISANVTAASMDKENTRIAAGGLNNPVIFERNAEGLSVSQLITDFGRTANLTASAKSRARAEQQNAEATRAQILLQVTATYFAALQAQSVLRVAEQTVKTRQLLLDQISALASNKLKSELDVSFARVSLEEGRLLRSKAENDRQAAHATLAAFLGEREQQTFLLAEGTIPGDIPSDAASLVSDALRDRPELSQLRFEHDAAFKFAKAEKALHYPTISAVGAVGFIPVHDTHLRGDYAAAGVNLNLPLFSGKFYSARQTEAELRAKAAEENLRDEENNVIRDVRIAWLNASNAQERVLITVELLKNASTAYDLAQARYQTGTSSIIELSQAELNKTAAEIARTNARYDAQIQQAILSYQAGRMPSAFRSRFKEDSNPKHP